MSDLLNRLLREREHQKSHVPSSSFEQSVNTLYGNVQYGRTNSLQPQRALDGYSHFRGRPYTVITFLARKIAERQVRISRIMTPDERIIQDILTKRTGRVIHKEVPEWELPLMHKTLAKNMFYDDEHFLHRFFRSPNPLFTWFDLMFSLVCSLELTGQGFLWMVQDGDEFQAWPLPSHWVTLIPDPNCVLGRWRITPQGTASFELDFHELVYVRYVSPFDPMASYGPMEAMAFPIAAAETIQIAQQKAFENGIHPGLALIVGDTDPTLGRPILEREERHKLIDLVKQVYQGVHQNGNPLILDGLIQDAKTITTSPSEMDFTGSDQLITKKIEQGWGVSPFMLGEMEGANRASATIIEQMTNVNVINPRLQNISAALTRYFQARIPNGDRVFVSLELCEKKDPDFTLQQALALFTQGALTYNQLLASQGFPPIDGGDILAKPLGSNMGKPASMPNMNNMSGSSGGGSNNSSGGSALDLSVGGGGNSNSSSSSSNPSNSNANGPTSSAAPMVSDSMPKGFHKAFKRNLSALVKGIDKSSLLSNEEATEWIIKVASNFYLHWINFQLIQLNDKGFIRTTEVSQDFLLHCSEKIKLTNLTNHIESKENMADQVDLNFVVAQMDRVVDNKECGPTVDSGLWTLEDCHNIASDMIKSYLEKIGERPTFFEAHLRYGFQENTF